MTAFVVESPRRFAMIKQPSQARASNASKMTQYRKFQYLQRFSQVQFFIAFA